MPFSYDETRSIVDRLIASNESFHRGIEAVREHQERQRQEAQQAEARRRAEEEAAMHGTWTTYYDNSNFIIINEPPIQNIAEAARQYWQGQVNQTYVVPTAQNEFEIEGIEEKDLSFAVASVTDQTITLTTGKRNGLRMTYEMFIELKAKFREHYEQWQEKQKNQESFGLYDHTLFPDLVKCGCGGRKGCPQHKKNEALF